MTEKERRVSENSLANLKLGAESRRLGKVRHNFTILPETVQWLKGTGNASDAIDALVAQFKNNGINSNHTHDKKEDNQVTSDDVYKRMETLQAELDETRRVPESLVGQVLDLAHKPDQGEVIAIDTESNKLLKDEVSQLKAELDQLQKERSQLDQEVNQLHALNGDLNLMVTNLQEKLAQTSELHSDLLPLLPDLESVRDRILSQWKVQKRAESKDRIKEALDKFIAEV